jgi:hypothetical protein
VCHRDARPQELLAWLATARQPSATHQRPRQLTDLVDLFNASIFRPRLHTQAMYYLQLNIFTTSISFDDLLYMLFPALLILPLDMLEGLALPTCRSPDLRVQFLYLVLCSPPPRHARGLGLANLRVARPVAFYFSCAFFH